ncbi:Spy/CpxP family protein refolding chaperone [Oceanirhabdus sp. W0125-5]|uniref:Spy/CpxP family protein refolding chaperone n=1 Tax=Oceanirhabdus sp. W0125-5 TaxID=2999116 RepID=UPI0022F34543|nr:Spy/CpxP family protein refolding chaperone [Oceanirhabdus sp. W0125-5]WBW96340.1 Spy/CpxP family protein refolding chaperone [Oceanirhabdus sp. W0125-5]
MYNKKLIKLLLIPSLLLGSVGYLTLQSAAAQSKEQQNVEVQNTDEHMIEKVKSILSKYDFSTLTVEEAKEINEGFRSAGFKGGRELEESIRAAGYDPTVITKLDPPPESKNDNKNPKKKNDSEKNERKDDTKIPERKEDSEKALGQNYSIEQAISDNAQLHTIAFDALAFFTGELGSDSFFPPGKVSDFFGFQYFRDVDAGELGHNTTFLSIIANNVLSILNDDQLHQLKSLAVDQEELLIEYGYDRFPLMDAFRRLLKNDLPSNTTSLNLDAVTDYSSNLYEIDGLLSYNRAKVLGNIINSLDDEQRAYLDEMAAGSSLTWPKKEDQIDKKDLTHEQHVLLMTYASEMFSWYAGDVDSDTYFCPERHGTYFGSFYMKDMPAMGNPDYTISTSITGDSGKEFLNILTDEQKKLITDLVDIQRDDLLEIVETRREIASQLREFINGTDVDQETILQLSRKYGELDGAIVHSYATHFSKVYETLTEEQKEQLVNLRNLDDYQVKGAFLYSEPIDMPDIIDTDYLFE